MGDPILFVAAAVLSIVGFCFIFLPDAMEWGKIRRCTYMTNAEIVHMMPAHTLRAGKRVEHTYWTTWKYTVNGVEHTSKQSMEIKERGRKVGSVERIYVNPDNLDDIYMPKEIDRVVRKWMKIMGVFVLIGALQGWLEAFGVVG